MARPDTRIPVRGPRFFAGVAVLVAIVAVAGVRLTMDTSAPVPSKTHYMNLVVQETDVEIAPGETVRAYAYNGSIPGPVLRVRQGDVVNFTLTNTANNTLGHSIDFHAARVAWNLYYRTIAPGQTINFEWTAEYPGVFMYHCGTAPVIEHIAKGMYGMIVVEPSTPFPEADKEFFLVQSEMYTTMDEMMNKTPKYVVFNGYHNKYLREPLEVEVGENVRVLFLNAGPSLWSA
ncbi:MAG TPA: multicopper oxidase domain-containing protein, partial [Thermoplasmata archaeon]|nr:multicopper oxidase domain-containing protein [Thermoplasmata archaeon]